MASAKKYSENRNKGLCGNCGKIPVLGSRLCNSCRAALKNVRNRRIEKGLCVRCADIALSNFRVCKKCLKELREYARINKPTRWKRFFLNALGQVRLTRGGRRLGGGPVTARDLLFLWKRQRGLCSLTGERLTRENAEIDHIIPTSRGGTNGLSNLQWAIKEPNRSKQGMLISEFVAMCSKIVNYAGVKN